MKTDNWGLIESIYDQAIELDQNKQQSFVEENANGDRDIVSQVMKMLESKQQDFMGKFPGKISVDNLELSQPKTLGNFKIIKKIATGGMGRVYLAESISADVSIKVALKTIRIELINENLKTKFQNEKSILSKLSHKNIATLIDAGVTDENIPYIATEWVDGENIKKYCLENKLSIKQRLKLFLQICSAVSFAHNKLIIHRDLKPDNILVDSQGQVKLLDFGIAKIIDENQSKQTQTQIYTPDYAAPEQVNGESCSLTTDVYALGVVLFEILTNTKRFELRDLSVTDKMKAVNSPTNPIIKTLKVNQSAPYSLTKISGTLETIINKAMHVDPNRRYQSVYALVADIENYLEQRPIKAMRDSVFYKTKMLLLRNKLASVFLLMVFVSILSGWYISNQQFKLKQQEAEKSKILLDFFDVILNQASPIEGGSLNMSVREMFETGITKFDIEKIDDLYLKAEVASKISLIYSQLSNEEQRLKYNMIPINYYENNLSPPLFASRYVHHSVREIDKMLNKRQYDEAIDLINSVLKKVKNYSVIDEEMSNINIVTARIYGAKGDKNKSFEYFAKAQVFAENVNSHSHLGEINYYKEMLFYASNTYEESVRYLTAAEYHFKQYLDSEYNPNLNAAISKKGDLLSRNGRHQEAEDMYKEVSSQQHKTYGKVTYVSLINRANNLIPMGLFDQALNYINLAEEIFQQEKRNKGMDYYGLLLYKANSLVGLERYAQAGDLLNQTLDFMQSSLPVEHRIIKIVANDLAYFHLKSGDINGIQQSKILLKSYLDNDSDTSPLTESVRLTSSSILAQIYFHDKEYRLATQYFEKANAITSINPDKYKQGWFYWQLQTGLELCKIKQGNLEGIEKFKSAKKQLLALVSEDGWYDNFYSNM